MHLRAGGLDDIQGLFPRPKMQAYEPKGPESSYHVSMSMKQMCPACRGRRTNGNGRTCQACQGSGEMDSKPNFNLNLSLNGGSKPAPVPAKASHS